MKIEILCSDPSHPVNPWLQQWREQVAHSHVVSIVSRSIELTSGDVLFLISCSEIIPEEIQRKYRCTLVLHASDLPKGRGWSPHIWQILEGKSEITVSLLDASERVDTGAIWAKRTFHVPAHALFDEINEALFETETALITEGLRMLEAGEKPKPQPEGEASYYPRRTPENSEIDPEMPLRDLFNTIRVCDPKRYPAFFNLHGQRYTIQLTRVSPSDDDLD